jgi:NAD(P)H-hydrate epimerase
VGRVLVVGGSAAMAGAPSLAGLGALRGGAGLVQVAVPRGIQPVVAGFRPETTTRGLPQTAGGAVGRGARAALEAALPGWDAVVLGPGLGRAAATQGLVRAFTPVVAVPLVLDADALFAFNGRTEDLRARRAPTVLTPHEGEAARLLGTTSAEVHAERQGVAADLAARAQGVIVLKGPGTIVTDGRRLYVNRTGGPALATGGTGDVLAGLVAALLAGAAATGLDAFEAACIAVHAHGAAADAVAGGRDRGLLASDLAAGLPDALAALRPRRRR